MVTLTPSDFNSGRCATLDQARIDADIRAAITGRSVNIYQHVGGLVPGAKARTVGANGSFLWRDTTDDMGVTFADPKFVWRLVETITPKVGADD